jgi:thioredoxin-dependent peroxiredoxin
MRLAPFLLATVVACGLLVGPVESTWAADLKPGDPAPDFSLPGTDGKTYSLRQLQGRWVILAWFPKAFTGG